jgi:hypothetical protein
MASMIALAAQAPRTAEMLRAALVLACGMALALASTG